MMRVGIAGNHGGFTLKGRLAESLRGSGFEVVDFGAHQLKPEDDYADFIIPLARALAAGEVPGVRAGLIHDVFSTHYVIQYDDMNLNLYGRKCDRCCASPGTDRISRKVQRSLLLSEIVWYLMKSRHSHLRLGGELKVKLALPRENSRGRAFFIPTNQAGARSCRTRVTR